MPKSNDPTPAAPATTAPPAQLSDAGWKPVARSDIVFRQLADEWVLFDSKSNQIHVLNLTAARVWLECDGTRTTSAITDEVHADFDDAPDRTIVRADVLAALADFVERDLVS